MKKIKLSQKTTNKVYSTLFLTTGVVLVYVCVLFSSCTVQQKGLQHKNNNKGTCHCEWKNK